MRVTFSCNRIEVNGKLIGYYEHRYSGEWFASFYLNNMKYMRTAIKLNSLEELVRNVINDNE